MNAQIQSSLAPLLGLDLASVEFVRDYLQLRFDGPVLSMFTAPSIQRRGTPPMTRSQPGYCDALVSLIGRQVTRIREDDHSLELQLGDASIVLSLLDSDRGTEAAILDLDDKKVVW